MEELVRRLWRDIDIAPPWAQSPLAPMARVLDGCGLNTHEVAFLTRRLALSFLSQRGIPIHALQESLSHWGSHLGCSVGEASVAQGMATPIGWDEPLAGFLFANEGGAAVFVRQGDPIARRRFSAAHEMGHYVLHFVPQATRLFARRESIQFISQEPAPTPCPAPPTLAMARSADGAPEPTDEREAEADAFAAELLMPARLVCELAAREQGLWSENDLIWRLSQEMLVSRLAMWKRLSQLGWVRIASPYNG